MNYIHATIINLTTLLSLLLFNSCQHERKPKAIIAGKPTYNVLLGSSEGTFDICDAIEDMSVLSLERTDSSTISNINKVILADGRYYVLDKKFVCVSMFDENGRYLGRLGAFGGNKDAGEYFEVQDLIYHRSSKTLWLYTNGSTSILEFGLDGKFQRRIQTDIFASSIATNDSYNYFYINNNVSLQSKQFNLLITDTSRRIIKRLFPMPKSVTESLAFSGSIHSGEDYIIFNPLLHDVIYKVAGTEIIPEFSVDFGKYTLPEKLATSENIASGEINQYAFLTESIAIASNILAFRYRMNKSTLWAFFNKKNNHVALYNSESKFPARLLYSKFNESNNQIITSLPEADSLLKLSPPQQKYLESRFPSFKSSLSKVKDASNPILVFIQLKDF